MENAVLFSNWNFGGPLLQSAILLAITLAAAWLVQFLLGTLVPRFTRRTRTKFDDRLLSVVRGPAASTVVLGGLALVTLRLDPTGTLNAGALDLTRLLLHVLATLAIIIWTVAAIRAATLVLEAAHRHVRFVETRTLPLFRNLASILLVSAAAYFVFLTWGIDVTAWLASAGIIGIALGFAAKDTLSNFFAGIFILTDAPYQVGDVINLDSGERGTVTHVGIRSTRILTRDDVEITLPNALIGNSKIVNESGGRWKRERLRVGVSVAYGSDVDRVRQALLAVAAANDSLCEEPEPRVRFRSFGDSGLEFELLVWIGDPSDRGVILDALNTAVYKQFAADGIEIPFPKRDVYIRGLPGAIEELVRERAIAKEAK